MNIRQTFSSFLILLTITINSTHAESINVLQSMVDWSCIQFEIIGPCVKATPPYVGVKIRYWQPVLITETVKKPGDVVINELKPIVGSALQNASQSLMSTVANSSVAISSSSTCNADDTNTQMNEVHVYGFPFEQVFNGMVQMQCPEETEMNQGVIYLSELDSVEWRLGFMEAMNPRSLMSAGLGPICSGVSGFTNDLCMGMWGPTYPRRGFFTHHSAPVGSAADSFRAISIAGNNLQTPHIMIRPLLWQANPQTDKIQPLYPNSAMCLRIGENPLLWESGKTSIDGKYLWVYWKKKECCIF